MAGSANGSDRGGDATSVLVVVLTSTRGWELTAENLISNVVEELDADLALCVNAGEPHNSLYDAAKYVWRLVPSDDDWAEAFDRTAGHSRWRILLEPGGHLFGGVKDAENPQETVTAAPLYFRRFLNESMRDTGLAQAYDWLVVTRSDFLWRVPHPRVELLSDRRIYVLDGEEYGGVEDRHIVVPRRHVDRFLGLTDPIYSDPDWLKRYLDRRSAMQGWAFLNLERFVAARLKQDGLWRSVRHLPYVPYMVRGPGGTTSWSVGEFNEELGYYIKYPSEFDRSEIGRPLVPDQAAWGRYLAPVRGARMRWQLQRACHEADREAGREMDLYQRPFPLRKAPLRGARLLRWSLLRGAGRIRTELVPAIGSLLRRLPGMPALLDARIRRMRRRAQH